MELMRRTGRDFPSFSEGLSLRVIGGKFAQREYIFPFLFGGTFIEGPVHHLRRRPQ